MIFTNRDDKPNDEPAVMPWLFSKRFRQNHADKVKEIKAGFKSNYLPRNLPSFQRQMQANTTHNYLEISLKRNKVFRKGVESLPIPGGEYPSAREFEVPILSEDLFLFNLT